MFSKSRRRVGGAKGYWQAAPVTAGDEAGGQRAGGLQGSPTYSQESSGHQVAPGEHPGLLGEAALRAWGHGPHSGWHSLASPPWASHSRVPRHSTHAPVQGPLIRLGCWGACSEVKPSPFLLSPLPPSQLRAGYRESSMKATPGVGHAFRPSE